jgi:hypothetical protein
VFTRERRSAYCSASAGLDPKWDAEHQAKKDGFFFGNNFFREIAWEFYGGYKRQLGTATIV